MLLSQRYLELFKDLDACLANLSNVTEAAQRTCWRESAWRLQEQCGAVAHCIALFGDLEVENVTDEHVARASSFRCSGKHPWLSGLRLVREDLFGMD